MYHTLVVEVLGGLRPVKTMSNFYRDYSVRGTGGAPPRKNDVELLSIYIHHSLTFIDPRSIIQSLT